jgi:hypothetical protein
MAAAASTLLSQWIKTRRAIRDFVLLFDQPPALCEAESVIGARVDLVEDDRCFCCCAGAVRPRIYISTGMVQKLSATEVVAVLAHEREHARKRDPVRAAATRIAARALFYVPLARHLAEKSLVDSELGADSSAVSRVGREPLVSALLQVLGEARPVLGGATEMASLDALDLRIETLRTRSLPPVRPSLTVIVGTVIAVGAMWGLLLWLPPTVKGAEIGHTHITAHHRSPGKQ